jgi:hypothetical protein
VQEAVLPRFQSGDLRQAAGGEAATGEDLARHIWHALVPRITSGRLSRIHLVHSRDLSFDYCG